MIGFLLLMAVLFLKGTKNQSVDEYYLTHMEDIQEDSETVTISIRCDTLRESENWKNLKKQLQDEKYVPEDGVILLTISMWLYAVKRFCCSFSLNIANIFSSIVRLRAFLNCNLGKSVAHFLNVFHSFFKGG